MIDYAYTTMTVDKSRRGEARGLVAADAQHTGAQISRRERALLTQIASTLKCAFYEITLLISLSDRAGAISKRLQVARTFRIVFKIASIVRMYYSNIRRARPSYLHLLLIFHRASKPHK